MTSPSSPTSSADPPPGCWGRWRGRGDEGCTRCGWAERCRRTSWHHRRRLTVRERAKQLADAVAPVGRAPSAEELAATAQDLFVGLGAPRWRSWRRNARMVGAMRVVLAACAGTGADPELYVRAQVETIGYVLAEKGVRFMQPGCFHGAAADERFDRWAARKNLSRASLTKHREDEKVASARATAAFRYAKALLAGGADEAVALEDAREVVPGWAPGGMTEAEAVAALRDGLDACQPGLSDVVLMPDDMRWTWWGATCIVRQHLRAPARPVTGWAGMLESLSLPEA